MSRALSSRIESCRFLKLETLGIPINSATAINHDCWYTELSEFTPWIRLLRALYVLKSSPTKNVLIINVSKTLAYEIVGKGLTYILHPSAYDAFHYYQDRGFGTVELPPGYYKGNG